MLRLFSWVVYPICALVSSVVLVGQRGGGGRGGRGFGGGASRRRRRARGGVGKIRGRDERGRTEPVGLWDGRRRGRHACWPLKEKEEKSEVKEGRVRGSWGNQKVTSRDGGKIQILDRFSSRVDIYVDTER